MHEADGQAPDKGGWPLKPTARAFDVWTLSDTTLAKHGEALCHYVSTSEHATAARMVLPKDRWRYLIYRGALRWLLGSYLKAAPVDLCFHSTQLGKPYVNVGDVVAPIEFNVSHSADLLVVAVSRCGAVGIDIEYTDRNEIEKIAGRILSSKEKYQYYSLDQHERNLALWRIWTRKEAYLKGVGLGLTESLKNTTVMIDTHSAAGLVYSELRPEDTQIWRLHEFWPAPHVLGTVAIRHKTACPRFFTADDRAFGGLGG